MQSIIKRFKCYNSVGTEVEKVNSSTYLGSVLRSGRWCHSLYQRSQCWFYTTPQLSEPGQQLETK